MAGGSMSRQVMAARLVTCESDHKALSISVPQQMDGLRKAVIEHLQEAAGSAAEERQKHRDAVAEQLERVVARMDRVEERIRRQEIGWLRRRWEDLARWWKRRELRRKLEASYQGPAEKPRLIVDGVEIAPLQDLSGPKVAPGVAAAASNVEAPEVEAAP